MNEEIYALATAARQPLLDAVKKGRYENCCSIYSVVYKDKSYIPGNTNCYADLQYLKSRQAEARYGIGEGDPLALVLYRSEKYSNTMVPSDEVRITYLKWLLNESPWASAFVDKNPEEVFHSRLVTIETDVDGRILGGACVGFRRMWEYAQIVQTWFDLVSVGVHSNLAYFLAVSSTGAKGDTIYWHHYAWGHLNLCHEGMSRKGLLNFVKGTPVGKERTYKVSGAYKNYSGMFYEADGKGDIDSWIHDNFPYKDEKPKVEVVNKNPFVLAKPKLFIDDKVSIAYEKGIERMAEFSKTILKEIGYE